MDGELEPELELDPDSDELPDPEPAPALEPEGLPALEAVLLVDAIDDDVVDALDVVDVVDTLDFAGWVRVPLGDGPPAAVLDDFAGVVVGEEISVAEAELSAATLSFAATFGSRPLTCEAPGGGAIDDEGVIEQQLCSTIPRGAETPAMPEPRPSFCSVKASSFPVTSSPLAD